MVKAIVTGANGFVGSAVVKRLVEEKVSVVAIDISFSNSRLPESPLIKQLELSTEEIMKLTSLYQEEKIDVFYHFAWKGSAGDLRKDETVQISNALQTLECLKCAEKLGCSKFVVAGSIMEFEINASVYAQGTSPKINNIYSCAKVLAHSLCKMYSSSMSIEVIWGYITNTFGVGEKSPRLINTTIRNIISGNDLFFTSAEQTYDFIYIDDVADAFYKIGIYGKKNNGYIIGSGKPRPLKSFLIEICETLKSQKKPVFGAIEFDGISLPKSVFSTHNLEKDCGFKCKTTFSDGIIKTYKYLLKEENYE